MHTIHVLHMLQLRYPKGSWRGLAEVCVLHVLLVCGVEPLLYTMQTVCIRVAHVT